MTRQRLGQHFLQSEHALGKITDALDLKKNDLVVEIGAGHGELTDTILKKNPGVKIIAVEKDLELVQFLETKFAESPSVKIFSGDIRDLLQSKKIAGITRKKPYKLVGNIPYYLTGYLLRLISELEPKPTQSVLMVQKEVGERILTRAPNYNKLAASVEFWAEPKFILSVPKKDFAPPPKVDSIVLSFSQKNKTNKKFSDSILYYRMVVVLFAQPRKTIRNNLAAGFKNKREKIPEFLQKADISPELRPQNLNYEQIFELAELFLS